MRKNTGLEHRKEENRGKTGESSSVGDKIKEFREERGLSQYRLAQKADVSQSFLSALEAGKKSPTVETLEKICRGLGISLAEFFSRGNPRRFPNLPPHIGELIDELRYLSPEQVEHLTGFIRSMDVKGPDSS